MEFNKVNVSDILNLIEFDIVWSPKEKEYVVYDLQTGEFKSNWSSENKEDCLEMILDYVADDYFIRELYDEISSLDYGEIAKWLKENPEIAKEYNSDWDIDVIHAIAHPEYFVWDLNNDWKMTEDMEVNAFKETMLNSIPHQNDGCVGIFWYDVNNNELFGVDNPLIDACQEYKSNLFNNPVRTTPKLHVDVWNKQARKGKDSRFQGDYTLIPRGRVFCETLEDGSLLFKIMVGNWINDYPEAKDLIIEEFDLQDKNYEFKIDEHWDIGHGYSDELL